jgi:hypothetical protein
VLHLLVDTSTWLDLARRRDGQKVIGALRQLRRNGEVELLVPVIVLDEYERNRPRIEASMTASIAERFRTVRRDVDEFGGEGYRNAIELLDGLAHEMPLIGAMTTRNFDDILGLLREGQRLEPGDEEHTRVVQRGLRKAAPFHRSRNSVADALIIELYGTRLSHSAESDTYAFVTSNSEDFSLPDGDARLPHPDLAEFFSVDHSTYALGMAGLEGLLRDEFGDNFEELLEESDFREEPRRLDEILEAEGEYFDRVWYHRSLMHQRRLEDEESPDAVARLLRIAGPGRTRVETKYTEPGQLGPYTDFELGMLNGKLSALRWILGSEWDFLDT